MQMQNPKQAFVKKKTLLFILGLVPLKRANNVFLRSNFT
jgi:hypothetical protein